MVVHLSWGLGMYLYTLDHVDPNTTILAVCKLRIYILQCTAMMYRWCLTAACFDRYTLSALDARLRNFAQIHIARRVVVGIILVWIVLPVHTLIFYNLKGNTCGIVYSIAAALYHSIFTTIMGGILPVVIMLVCALLIHRNLSVKRQRRRQLSVNQQSGSQSRNNYFQSRRDQQVLLMLVVQVLIYGILVTPLMIWYFYSAITLNVPNKSANRVAIEHFLMFTTELLLFGFPASSFYLYTLASRMFRAELMVMIRDILSCKWSNNTTRIGPTRNENEVKTATGRLSKPKSIPALNYSNREQLEDVIKNNEQPRNLAQT